MKTKTLTKIALASLLGVPTSCVEERGVIVYKQDLPEEKALYVNLIRLTNLNQKPLRDLSDEIFEADRKLIFQDTAYLDIFNYALPGDTISFRHANSDEYLQISPTKQHVRSINGIKGNDIIEFARRSKHQKQK